MANTRIMYWGGGLNKLDQVAALSRAPCFDEPQPADILLLHDVLSDQIDRKDLKAKYEAVKREAKKSAPKDAKIVVVPGQNDDEKLLNEVLGEYVLRGAGEVAGRKLFGISTYYGQTELTPKSKTTKTSLEEELLKESETAEIFVSSAPVPRHYKSSLSANKHYRSNQLLHLQDAYLEPWKNDGTENGHKCKILITPASVDDFEKNAWSPFESSVILNAGAVYPKPGSHNEEHALARNFAYLIDYDDNEGVSKFRAIGPNGHRLTIFQRPYIFERAANTERGITRFNLKVANNEEEKKKATTVRVNPAEDVEAIVKKAEIVYQATYEVNAHVAGVMKPVAYLGQKTPKGKPRLPKNKKTLDAIADITEAFYEAVKHDGRMEKYHVIASAFEKHGTRLKGVVRSHAKRMIKGYAQAIKSDKELYAEIRGLEKRLIEIHQNAVADAKAEKAAKKAAREARKAAGNKRGPPKWKQMLDLQVKLHEEVTLNLEQETQLRKGVEKSRDEAARLQLAEKDKREAAEKELKEAKEKSEEYLRSNDGLQVRCAAAESESKSLAATLAGDRQLRGEHDRLYDLSDEANKRGISAPDPDSALNEFNEALEIMNKDPILHEKRRNDFLYNIGLAQTKQGSKHLNGDTNIAKEKYALALTTLNRINGDKGADELAEAIRKTVDVMNRPPEPPASPPAPIESEQVSGSPGKIEQPFDFTPPQN